MQYFGGKARSAKAIAAEIERVRPPGSPYWEPFVGGCNVLPHVSGERYATDSNAALITLYTSYLAGWRPPEHVTRELYSVLKQRQDAADPATAFAGFGCSYSGKWFGGYIEYRKARCSGNLNNPATNAARSLDRKLSSCEGVLFVCMDYREADPVGCTIYADPPYAGRTGYDGVAAFDSGAFFDWARRVSRRNVLLISEYEAPDDFVAVAVTSRTINMRGRAQAIDARTRLFRWRG